MYTYVFIYRFRSLPGIEALLYTHTAVGFIGSSQSIKLFSLINNINTLFSCSKSLNTPRNVSKNRPGSAE